MISFLFPAVSNVRSNKLHHGMPSSLRPAQVGMELLLSGYFTPALSGFVGLTKHVLLNVVQCQRKGRTEMSSW